MYLFSRMNVGSYGPTEPHLWLASEIPTHTWDHTCSISERKRQTHTYDDLVDLLIELVLQRKNDTHIEKFLKRHLGRGANPTPERGEGNGPNNPTNTKKGGGKGGGYLRAMSEVKPEAGVQPFFYCKPLNDKGGPCLAHYCDHRSGCVLQLKRQQHTKDRKKVTHQDHFTVSGVRSPVGTVANIVTTRANVTSKKVRVTNTNARRLNAKKPKHPPELPRMGTKVVNKEARGGAKVEPPTPRRSHQRPLLLILLTLLPRRKTHRGITPPMRGLTPRRGDWPGWPSFSWRLGLM